MARRFEDGLKGAPGCARLLWGAPRENEIAEFVRHGAPGYPTRVHGFAANPAADLRPVSDSGEAGLAKLTSKPRFEV
jgi:hypothetical protein